jgi:hypothetical protein
MSKCLSCDKQASLNLPNNPPKYCKDHKTIGMVNVTHKKCIHGKRKQVCIICDNSGFCKHKREIRKCIECNGSGICEHKKRKWDCKLCDGVSYCVHNKYKFYCIECSGSGICIHKKRKTFCKECKGSSICIHNKEKRHCKECGGSSLCKTPNCETRKIAKYDGHCAFCYYHLFPDKPNSRNYKTKERSVTEFIIDTFPEYTWISDKKVEDGCSLRRPDLLLDLGYQVIIIEIDETQHRNYEEICNNRRTMEISKDLDHRPIIFIRFNPDSYKDNDNKLINSCWIINKDGLCGLNKKYVKNWSERLNTLKSLIEYWCNDKNKSDKIIHVEYLFFDECSNEEIEKNNQNTFYIV